MLFRLFRLSLRFVIPLALVLALFAYALVPLVENITLRWFIRDLDTRSQMLSTALQDPLIEALSERNNRKLVQLFERSVQDDRLYALAYCDVNDAIQQRTNTYPMALGCPAPLQNAAFRQSMVDLPRGPVHVTSSPLFDGETKLGTLVLVHDMSFIQHRSEDTRKYIFWLFSALLVVVSLIAIAVAHWSWRDWTRSVKSLLKGELGSRTAFAHPSPELQPLAGDLRMLLNEYKGERQRQVGAVGGQPWSPGRLRSLLHDELAGDQVLVVSNREPYIHTHTSKGIEVRRPASGLVTAVEPVMRACSGTWIAHGAGTADRETVDQSDRVPVPPGKPAYTLRRVWLSKEEEQGYYYGFANEGLWPLCHIAHVRPVFRSTDWDHYVEVNQRFADAVISEAHGEDPVVLVQDYHFALLPRMVREVLPKATIITFWHIPWPNPESFGICPWREEILEGLLGSTILGFHTPFHCKNFLETVDRFLEARIEHEASTISFNGELTQVEPYPISIAWPEPKPDQVSVQQCRRDIRKELDLSEDHLLGVGVDRLDYTKGIIERFQAVERLLELHPQLVGKFSLVQIAAPSRSSLDEYQNFEARVKQLEQRINSRFGNGKYLPIILKMEHHESEEVWRYYRACDVCVVTSLHDGMNLVAKEFIASRDDEQGVLILSQFTGAARELHEALIINPYHIEQGAEALHRALTMPAVEQRERMHSMRALVEDFNIYRWAARMLLDAARLRRRQRTMEKIHSHSRKYLRSGV